MYRTNTHLHVHVMCSKIFPKHVILLLKSFQSYLILIVPHIPPPPPPYLFSLSPPSLTAPAAPLRISVHDIGPTSVRLEWQFSSDNGGAPVIGIRVTFKTLSSTSDSVDIAVSPDQTSALVPGLRDNHQYVFSVQARNRIGKLLC